MNSVDIFSDIIFSKDDSTLKNMIKKGINPDDIFVKYSYYKSNFEWFLKFEGNENSYSVGHIIYNTEPKATCAWPLLFVAFFFGSEEMIIRLLYENSSQISFVDENYFSFKDIIQIKKRQDDFIYYLNSKIVENYQLTLRGVLKGKLTFLNSIVVKIESSLYDLQMNKLSDDYSFIDKYKDNIFISIEFDHDYIRQWNYIIFQTLEKYIIKKVPLKMDDPYFIYQMIKDDKLYFITNNLETLYKYDILLDTISKIQMNFPRSHDILIRDNTIYSISHNNSKFYLQSLKGEILTQSETNLNMGFNISKPIFFQNYIVVSSSNIFFFFNQNDLKMKKMIIKEQESFDLCIENINDKYLITSFNSSLLVWEVSQKEDDFDLILIHQWNLNLVFHINQIRYCPIHSNLYIDDFENTIVYFLNFLHLNWERSYKFWDINFNFI